MTKAKPDWVTLNFATELIAGQIGVNSIFVENLMITAIKCGNISIRGKRVEIVDERQDTCHELSNLIPKDRNRQIEVFLRNNATPPLVNLNEDRTRWNIDDGILIESIVGDAERLNAIYDVEVQRLSLDQFLTKRLDWPFIINDGRSRDQQSWILVTLALLRIERSGMLNSKHLSSPSKLQEAISKLLPEGLHPRSYRHDARYVYEMYVRDFDGANWQELRGKDEDFDLTYEMNRIAALFSQHSRVISENDPA